MDRGNKRVEVASRGCLPHWVQEAPNICVWRWGCMGPAKPSKAGWGLGAQGTKGNK